MTNSKHLGVLFSVVCLFGAGSQARADSQARYHDGFHFQFTGGFGYYNVSAEAGGVEQSFSGMTLPASLLLGGTVGPVAVGGGLILDYASSPTVEQNGMEVTGADISQFVVGLGLYGDYYLDPAKSGLHFQGFAGWGGLETSANGNVGGSDPTGLVTAVGAGYDWWISDQWSAGALARLIYAPLDFNGVGFTTLEPALVGTITWH
jgi:hypothetical protein